VIQVEKGQKCLAVVRVRGVSGVKGEVEDTLRMLNLARNCHATLIDDRPSYLGMLQKSQNHVTWGEVSKETIARLLRERGRTSGNKKLTDEHARKAGYDSLERLAEALHSLEVELNGLPGIKPVLRLHPPRKGFERSVKKSFKSGGTTGHRGDAINGLVNRMM